MWIRSSLWLALLAVNFCTGQISTDLSTSGGILSGNLEVGGPEEFELCNEDSDSDVGFCVNKGHCDGNRFISNGVNLGKCSTLDITGAQKDCCKINLKCGDTSSAIISYFSNPMYPATEREDLACNVKISARRQVCQLRVDFLDFELPAPTAHGTCSNQNYMMLMAPLAPLGVLGGRSQNRLCGLNKDQHLYIPVTPGDQVQIITTLSGVAAVPVSRTRLGYQSSSSYKWNLKITQVECESSMEFFKLLKAPRGCTQWFTDARGRCFSFNYDGYSRFAPDQDYAICIRNEGNTPSTRTCSITLRAETFGMWVGGVDTGVCESGRRIVNDPAGQNCCVDPASSYLGIVAGQPDVLNDVRGLLTRRYWCGDELGTTGQITSTNEPYVIKVYAGIPEDKKNHRTKPAKYDDKGDRYDDKGDRYDDKGNSYVDKGDRYDDKGKRYDDSHVPDSYEDNTRADIQYEGFSINYQVNTGIC